MGRRIKLHKEGYKILFVILFMLVMLLVVTYIESKNWILLSMELVFSIVLYSFLLYFFRNPSREIEVDDSQLIIAPADGTVVVTEPTEEWEYFGGQKVLQVSIFMSVFSVHANWYPVSGKVLYSKHHNGRHVAAYLPKSSHENERSTVVIQTEDNTQILLRQIAGALARRIVTYATRGVDCNINEQLGFIKFGSRVDLFLPLDTELYVKIGDHTIGNETIIARLPKKEENEG